jgi:hypothetical protein
MIWLAYLFITLEHRLEQQWQAEHKEQISDSIKWKNQIDAKQARKTELW